MIGNLHLTLILIQEKIAYISFMNNLSISLTVSPVFLTDIILAIFQ